MTAKDIMTTEIVTIHYGASIREAIRLCVRHKISGLVVIGDDGGLIGILSEKDVLVAYDFLGGTDSGIEEFISRQVVTISPDTPIEDVSRLLVQRNYRRVPVMAEGKLVGVVSRGDILGWLDRR